MMPLGESRIGLITAIDVWHTNPWTAYALAMGGNLLVVPFLFFGLEYLRQALARFWPKGLLWLDSWIEAARKKLANKYQTYGVIGLTIFTALPLPLVGAYTATAAAVAFKLPFKKAFPAIVVGVLISGLIVIYPSIVLGRVLTRN